jgi:endonuclease/exonuclease/phosphatase family metal-dependent hydrolase
VTWNIWWRYGPWRKRETVILSVLEELDPDVVCLQEVWQDETEDQARRLGEALSLRPIYDKASSSGGFGFGNAILSRWPVLRHESIELPSSPSEAELGGRRALLAGIDGPRGRFDVVSTHLCWRLHESAWRQKQVAALSDFVARHAKSGFPPIVCGDFNAVPTSDEIRMMTGEAAVPVPGLFFHDAWALGGDGGPGFTWNNDNAFSARSLEPNRRLDYIFVGDPHRQGGAGHVTHCRIIGSEVSGNIHGSDHFGVLAEIRY